MSSYDDDSRNNTTANNRDIPSFPDNTAIKHPNNDASIAADVHAFGQWSTRTGRFKSLIQHHAVSDRGKFTLTPSRPYPS